METNRKQSAREPIKWYIPVPFRKRENILTYFSDNGIPLDIGSGITIIAGQSGHGKTTLKVAMAYHELRKDTDKRIIYINLEQHPEEIYKIFLLHRLNDILGGVPIENWTLDKGQSISSYIHYLFQEESKKTAPKEIKEAKEWLDRKLAEGTLKLSGFEVTQEDLFQTFKEATNENEQHLIFIDYAQLILCEKPEDKKKVILTADTRTEQMKVILLRLKELVNSTNTVIILGSQFNRGVISFKDISITRLGESTHLELFASTIIALYNSKAIKIDSEENSIPCSFLGGTNPPRPYGMDSGKINPFATYVILKARDFDPENRLFFSRVPNQFRAFTGFTVNSGRNTEGQKVQAMGNGNKVKTFNNQDYI